MLRRLLYRTRHWNNRIQNNWSKQPIAIFSWLLLNVRLMRWSQRCFQTWDMLELSQRSTKLNDERPLSAGIFCWQPPPQQFLASAISFECAMRQPFWWMIHLLISSWSTIFQKLQTPQSNSKCLTSTHPVAVECVCFRFFARKNVRFRMWTKPLTLN